MLNQPLRYNTPNIVSDNPIENFYSRKHLLRWRNTNSLVSPDLQLVHLVGAVHVADQVDHTGAEKRRKLSQDLKFEVRISSSQSQIIGRGN
jgi:hypothetical protein